MAPQPFLEALTLTDVQGVGLCFWVPQNVEVYRCAIVAKISANRKESGRS
jgi:hypothetical protein